MNAVGHLRRLGNESSRRDDKPDERPAVPDQARKLQPIHRAGHIDVCQNHGNAVTIFQYSEGFIGIGSLDDRIASLLHDIHGGHADEHFVIDHQYARILQ